ncbi:hypothetical protein GE061_010798 [Apolygus lucorum]|uniref:Uncharacterized protein n=1 Tax=Apolygus lucorum TaxID=248454 RepID=A0A8S9XWV5_APOLU|nr:hypothetical protein GE061_010798 [Apolygus lucorum]
MTSIQSEEELENALDKCSLLPISEEQEENEEQMVLPDLETAVNCIVCDEICQDSTTCDDCNLPMHESCCEEGVKLCNLCSRRNSRKRNRATALEGSDQQAEKMMKHSRNRFPPASRGDSVRIHSVRE